MQRQTILIDAREFVAHRQTGIGRFLAGLLDALVESDLKLEILIAANHENNVPQEIRNHRQSTLFDLPAGFLFSEGTLTYLTKQNVNLYVSPYPKLPFLGTRCMALNTVHDVLDLTHPAYRTRVRRIVDRLRVRTALRRAALTWYVSSWSLEETLKCVGTVGRDPRVRYSAIDSKFTPAKGKNEDAVLDKYQLQPGYILTIGNGLPHKNLAVLLQGADRLSRAFVFVGLPEKNRRHWQLEYRNDHIRWIAQVCDNDLPAIIRNAFCLAQPSTAEGYGFPPLEAMACGTPAIASSIEVLKETTGGKALYAEPHDPRDWLEAFAALEDSTVYQEQIRKQLKWVEPFRGRKGWRRHISDIEELLNPDIS